MACGSITQKEAARRLRIHVNTVAAMLDDGRLTAVDVGNGSGAYGRYRHVDPASLPREERNRADAQADQLEAELRTIELRRERMRSYNARPTSAERWGRAA